VTVLHILVSIRDSATSSDKVETMLGFGGGLVSKKRHKLRSCDAYAGQGAAWAFLSGIFTTLAPDEVWSGASIPRQ